MVSPLDGPREPEEPYSNGNAYGRGQLHAPGPFYGPRSSLSLSLNPFPKIQQCITGVSFHGSFDDFIGRSVYWARPHTPLINLKSIAFNPCSSGQGKSRIIARLAMRCPSNRILAIGGWLGMSEICRSINVMRV